MKKTLYLLTLAGLLLSCKESSLPEEEQPVKKPVIVDAAPIPLALPAGGASYDLAGVQEVRFSWTAVDEVEDYDLLMSLSEDLSAPVIFVASGTSLDIPSVVLNDSLAALSDYNSDITHKVYWSLRPAAGNRNSETEVRFLTLKEVSGTLTLAGIFGHNMVLQQNTEAPVWGAVSSDSPLTVTVTGSWGGPPAMAASVNKKWRVNLPTPAGGGPHTVTITAGSERTTLGEVMVGEVWLASGQSNMALPLKGDLSANPPQPVVGSAEAIANSAGKNIRFTPNWGSNIWIVADPTTAGNCSAVGWFFADALHEQLGVPIGIINASEGATAIATWTPETECGAAEQEESGRYRSMIYPLKGFAIKGVIWYQGESDLDRADYGNDMKRLVERWRCAWEREFSFYYAQIAPFNYYKNFNWDGKLYLSVSAYTREIQLNVRKEIPHSGIAILMDVGEEDQIHPARKKEVGDRLAGLALANDYGKTGLDAESPELVSKSASGNAVTLTFNKDLDAGKFHTPSLFEIAARNKITFYPATTATVNGRTVVISSASVSDPGDVRYAFKDFAVGELFGTNGLPVSSFRTDKN
jgi:sialate O-acetylesterase